MPATPVLADRLFESDAPLSIRISADFSRIEDERDKTMRYPGELQESDRMFTVEITTRGNRRLSKTTCGYPPLWVEFAKGEVDESVFDHQERLKLVVACRMRGTYIDYLRAEFLTYKLFNRLVDHSFKARWADFTYADTAQGKTKEAPGFFIEHKSRFAHRAALHKMDIAPESLDQFDAEAGAKLALFQYIVGNLDYSLTSSVAGEEDCCHNIKLFVDSAGKYIPVAYDFDSSGLIDASYATPPDIKGITKVTQRRYRGYCEFNTGLPAVRQAFLGAEKDVLQIIDEDPLLGTRQKLKMVKFLEESFKRLRSEKRYKAEILRMCAIPSGS